MSILGKPASLIGAQMLRRDDGFSFQFSIPGDAMFWIRILQPATPVMVVSDLNFGSFDIYDMADLFAEAILQTNTSDPVRITFASVGPPETLQTAKNIVKIEKMIEAFLAGRTLFLTGNRITVQHGKTDLHLEFKSARSVSN